MWHYENQTRSGLLVVQVILELHSTQLCLLYLFLTKQSQVALSSAVKDWNHIRLTNASN